MWLKGGPITDSIILIYLYAIISKNAEISNESKSRGSSSFALVLKCS